MNQFEQLVSANPNLKMMKTSDAAFAPYGCQVKLDVSAIANSAKTLEIPKEGTVYFTADPTLESNTACKAEISKHIYGSMPIQVGYCAGQNSLLNAMEWHKGSETIIAATPMVLLVAGHEDLEGCSSCGYRYDTSKTVAVYLEAGEAVELYPYTLHFAPCNADKDGFFAVIILPEGTNEDLTEEQKIPYLGARNKWIIEHSDVNPDDHSITGENTKVAL